MGDRDEVPTVPDPDARGAAPPALDEARYRIGERIGKGGMGEVLLAHDRTIGRDVAIKRMLDAQPRPRALARFLREARIQGRLEHPSIVPVHELGVDEHGRPYFVMKRLSGITMRELLGDDRAVRRLLRAFVDVCLSIEYAHSRGVVHRDLKPENIMLGDFGEVYVLDWGVAKVIGSADAEPAIEEPPEDELATRAGTVIGTPSYMPPEQARGELDIDHRVDVYALGCILFEILTGEVWHEVKHARVVRDIPVELEALCHAAVVEERGARLETARALADGVQQFLDGDRDLAARRALADGHLANARAALASSDRPELRGVAMREAGVALALDPTRGDAAELISELILVPPPEPPPDVERQIEAERLALLQRNAGAATISLLGFIALTLVVYAATQARLLEIAIIVGMTLALVCETVRSRYATRRYPMLSLVIALALAVVVAMFARLYPPFLVAPALGALLAMTMPFTLQHQSRWFGVFCTVIMLVAVLVPFIGETLGWLSATYTFTADGVHLHSSALRGPVAWQIAIAIAYIIAAITFSGWMGYLTRQSEHTARRQLRVQAWHLAQLVRR
jgi:serine/threonine-protein kinase